LQSVIVFVFLSVKEKKKITRVLKSFIEPSLKRCNRIRLNWLA